MRLLKLKKKSISESVRQPKDTDNLQKIQCNRWTKEKRKDFVQ